MKTSPAPYLWRGGGNYWRIFPVQVSWILLVTQFSRREFRQCRTGVFDRVSRHWRLVSRAVSTGALTYTPTFLQQLLLPLLMMMIMIFDDVVDVAACRFMLQKNDIRHINYVCHGTDVLSINAISYFPLNSFFNASAVSLYLLFPRKRWNMYSTALVCLCVCLSWPR